MTTKTYFGKPCKYGHSDGNGKNLRLSSSGTCIQCIKERDRAAGYKEYRAAYHQKLRANNIEKLKQYRQTQIDKGNNNSKYEKDKTK
jgi:hypothetical protein